MRRKILVSAGEASGDLYASLVVEELRRIYPDAEFFGCTGPRLRAAGVRTVVDAASLAVVGLLEVVSHIPRIYGEYRKLLDEARAQKPDLAILTDSPDFHLRVARKLAPSGIPVVYLVAPQAWAWRKGRVKRSAEPCPHTCLCIFPFEEEFFRREGCNATLYRPPAGRAGDGRRSPTTSFFGNTDWPRAVHYSGTTRKPAWGGRPPSAGAAGCGGAALSGAGGEFGAAGLGRPPGWSFSRNGWRDRRFG